MDHKEKHHEHHRHEREEHKKERRHHEDEQESKSSLPVHPLWLLVVGLVLMAGVIFVWMNWFWV